MAGAAARMGLEACREHIAQCAPAGEQVADHFKELVALVDAPEACDALFAGLTTLSNGTAAIEDPNIAVVTDYLCASQRLCVQMIDWNAGKGGKGGGKSEARPTPCLGALNEYTAQFEILEISVATIISMKYAATHRGNPINTYTASEALRQGSGAATLSPAWCVSARGTAAPPASADLALTWTPNDGVLSQI